MVVVEFEAPYLEILVTHVFHVRVSKGPNQDGMHKDLGVTHCYSGCLRCNRCHKDVGSRVPTLREHG